MLKNKRIEKLISDWSAGHNMSHAAVKWFTRYNESLAKDFDEIVIMDHECVHENEVAEMLEVARLMKIEYFVYASGFSSAFSVVNEMVKNGAKVGKFVVKTYEEDWCGEHRTVEVSGLRINL